MNLKQVYCLLADFNDTVNPKKDIILCYLGDADLDEETVRLISF